MAESRARTLANLANTSALSVDGSSLDVGISSASPDSDLNVGSSIKMDGPSGIITASKFSGDGSLLIGVASTDNIVTGTAATFNNEVDVNGFLNVGANIQLGTAGVITATSFTGDGANLTNVGVDTATVDTGAMKVSGISTLSGFVSLGSTVGAAASIYFPDNKGINFGNNAEGDLQIFHNGSNSFIKDTGTGALVISGSQVSFDSSDLSEFMIKAVENAQVELYHNGTKKFETNTDGFEVTHTGTASTSRFLASGSVGVGIGVTTTTGRDAAAGVGTVTGQIVYNESVGVVQFYNGTAWANISAEPFAASGGTKTTTPSTVVHTFTSPGTFSVTSGTAASNVNALTVGAGGGGAASQWSGGGGAGLLRYETGLTYAPGSYAVSVGGGGAGAPPNNTSPGRGSSGESSSLAHPTSPQSSPGGGGGWCNGPGNAGGPGGSGGSGGGAGAWMTTSPDGGGPNSGGSGSGSSGVSGTDTGTPGSGAGNDGGSVHITGGAGHFGGGGGGAATSGGSVGPLGAPTQPTPSGPGGNGLAYTISGSPVTYAGGGGGGGYYGPGTAGNGGPGGGGAGYGTGPMPAGTPSFDPTATIPSTGEDAQANRGGGGGAGSSSAPRGGNGGSGIVVISYPNAI